MVNGKHCFEVRSRVRETRLRWNICNIHAECITKVLGNGVKVFTQSVFFEEASISYGVVAIGKQLDSFHVGQLASCFCFSNRFVEQHHVIGLQCIGAPYFVLSWKRSLLDVLHHGAMKCVEAFERPATTRRGPAVVKFWS